jgi:2-desacetyl-2-hydroxyethyl bacteriochlorophyllide A dehydrogenase
MKAAILYGDRDIRIGEAPDPQIEPHEVLVSSRYAGICGTDLHVYRGEFPDRVSYPAILGHEFGGVVAEVGSEVTDYQPGDRVVVDPIISCHNCTACLTGHINACSTLKLLGIDLDGGFGQYVAVPKDRLYKLPDAIPMENVPMVELYSIGHHVLRRGRVQPGERVVILGAGKVGLSILDVLCHSAGPNWVLSTDLEQHRLDIADKLGAAVTVNIQEADPVEQVLALTDGEGADCVIEAIGHFAVAKGQDAPLQQAVEMVRNGGRIVTVGLGEQYSSVYFKTFVIKEAELIASRVTLGEFPRAIHLLSEGLLHPELLISHRMPIRDVAKAFAQLDQEDPETLKVVLDVQATD